MRSNILIGYNDLVRISLLADFRFQICVLLMVHYFLNSFVAFYWAEFSYQGVIRFSSVQSVLASLRAETASQARTESDRHCRGDSQPRSSEAKFEVRTVSNIKLLQIFWLFPPLPQEGPRQTAVDVLTLTPKETSPAFPPAAKPDIWIQFPTDPYVSICSVRSYHAVALLLVHIPSLRTAHPSVWDELNSIIRYIFVWRVALSSQVFHFPCPG